MPLTILLWNPQSKISRPWRFSANIGNLVGRTTFQLSPCLGRRQKDGSFRPAQTTHHSKILSQNNMRSRLKWSGPKVLLAFQECNNKPSQGCVDPETNQGLKGGKGRGEIRQTRLAWPASSCPLRPDLPPDRVCLHSLWRIPAYTADRSCTRVVLCTCTWPATPVAHSHPQKPNKCTDWLWHNSYSTDRMQIPRRETWHSPPSSGCQHS